MSDVPKRKVREPKKSSLRELFDRITHVNYVVISPFYQLPMEVPKCGITILTDNFAAINNIWNLTRYSAESKYSTVLASGEELIVTILEKGRNVFPETFETQILMRAVQHEGSIKVPDSETWPLLRLYWKLVYERLFADNIGDRKTLLDWVFRKTGTPIRTRYRWMKWDASQVIKEASATSAA
jgi:hypothetical protein